MTEYTWRNSGNHYNMGRGNGWQELHYCRENQRFSRLVGNVPARGGRFCEYRIDGHPCDETLIDTLLKIPPVVMDAEREALRLLSDTRPTERRIIDFRLARSLYDKGLINADMGLYWRTESGREYASR